MKATVLPDGSLHPGSPPPPPRKLSKTILGVRYPKLQRCEQRSAYRKQKQVKIQCLQNRTEFLAFQTRHERLAKGRPQQCLLASLMSSGPLTQATPKLHGGHLSHLLKEPRSNSFLGNRDPLAPLTGEAHAKLSPDVGHLLSTAHADTLLNFPPTGATTAQTLRAWADR